MTPTTSASGKPTGWADAVMRMSDPESTIDAEQNGPSDRIQHMRPRCQRRYRQGGPVKCEDHDE